jgi:hypothetical protein
MEWAGGRVGGGSVQGYTTISAALHNCLTSLKQQLHRMIHQFGRCAAAPVTALYPPQDTLRPPLEAPAQLPAGQDDA